MLYDQLLSSVSDCKYDAIIVTDHADVALDINFLKLMDARPPWRLNAQNFFLNALNPFFLMNHTPEVSASVLWATMKAFIRGEMNSCEAHQRKARRKKLAALIQHIALLDSIYATSNLLDICKKRMCLQTELDFIMSEHTTEQLFRSRANFY